MIDSIASAVSPFGRQGARDWASSKIGLLLLFVLGVAVIWLPTRAPMVDLPQHAGQIALLRDISLGRSPWAAEIRLNFFTPYLLAYGLAWPLSIIMPVAAAIKVVLTAAYAAFGLICIGVRAELKASSDLDAYYFLSFFGFAYSWGMYPFLVAAPVGLAFLWLSIRYARHGGALRGLALSTLGLALLFAHGLVFLFACVVGVAIVREKAPTLRFAIARSWPFAVPLVMCAALFFVTRHRETEVWANFAAAITMGPLSYRIANFLGASFDNPGACWPILGWFALVALPFVGGLRLELRRVESLVIAAGVIAVMTLAPAYAWSTGGIYPRFALFLPPAYAWLFSPANSPGPRVARFFARQLSVAALIIAAFVLAQHVAQAIMFSKETGDFDSVLARAEPGQRALSLMLDRRSLTNVNPEAYLHFPLWYQAEKHGLVDFNFAIYHPQIARFALPLPPLYRNDSFEWTPGLFDWRRDGGARYRYFFIRHTAPIPKGLFAGAPCAPIEVARSGPWELLRSGQCIGELGSNNSVANATSERTASAISRPPFARGKSIQ